MRRFAVICMCAVAIAGAVPSVPAFAATGNVVMAAKSRTKQSQSGLQDTAQAVQIAFPIDHRLRRRFPGGDQR